MLNTVCSRSHLGFLIHITEYKLFKVGFGLAYGV